MVFTIAKFFIVNSCDFGFIASNFFNACDFFSFPFALLDFLEDGRRNFLVAVQKILKFGTDKIVDKRPNGLSIGGHVGRTKLGLGLGFKNRLFNFDADRRHDRGSDIAYVVIFVVKMADGGYQGLAERSQMRTSLGGMLPVDEGIVLLTVLITV